MKKKAYADGWYLSVEELAYLVYTAHRHHPFTSSCSDGFYSKFYSLIVRLEGEALARYSVLYAEHREACAVYRYATHRLGLALRHGSQFGALFIGYSGGHPTENPSSVLEHGEILIFPPSVPGQAGSQSSTITALDAVRAVRVARSVGKKAVAYRMHDGGNAVPPEENSKSEEDDGLTVFDEEFSIALEEVRALPQTVGVRSDGDASAWRVAEKRDTAKRCLKRPRSPC